MPSSASWLSLTRVDLRFEARGGTVTVTTDAVRERVLPYLRQARARAVLVSILERANELRTWDLSLPDDPEAEEELVAQIMRAGGPALSPEGRPIRLYTVTIEDDREAFRYWRDTQPDIGEVIVVEGVTVKIERVLENRDAMMLECVRVSEPAE